MNKVIARSARLLNFYIFQQIYLLPHKFYIDQKIGSITSIINRAQKSLPTILWSVTLNIFPIFIEFLCIFYILLKSYEIYHALILIITILSFMVYTFFGTKTALREKEKAIEAEKKVDSKVIDWLKNLEIVRLFGKSHYAFKDYNDSLIGREKTEVNFLNVCCGLHLGQTILLGIGLSLMTYYLGQAVQEKEITLGDFVLFNAYFIQFIGPISILGYTFKDLKKSLLEIRDVILILDKVPPPQKNPYVLKGKEFSIEFKNVSFSYGGKKILNKLSFVINPGDLAIIIGPTGSGKSTILKLLTGFYEPDEGTIYINGINIKKICLDSLRKVIGVMPQDNNILDTTIKNNISFFDDEVSLSDLRKASKKAKIWMSIQKLPFQLDTLVGEGGSLLSGGEKQRICLARIFAKHPEICLFDEPTSFLDEKNAHIIYENIQKYLKKSTRIVITHKLSFIERADKVVTLE